MERNHLCEPRIYSGPSQNNWLARHRQLLTEISDKRPDIVFVGDSLTDQWRTTGRVSWVDHIEKYNAFDIGIGGDTSSGLLYRLESPELNGANPRIVVLCIGTNSICHETPNDIVNGVLTVANAVVCIWPSAHVLFQDLPI